MAATADQVRQALAELADPERAIGVARFFKTGPGGYGEGDVFLGATMPQVRAVVRRFRDAPVTVGAELLGDAEHEHRMAGLLLWVQRYRDRPDEVVDAYLRALDAGRIDNWDLVDASAEHIIGPHLRDDWSPLLDLAASDSLWTRRVAVLSTFAFIKAGDPAPTLALAERLLADREDLMHKAVGWMLREVGKRLSREALTGFLDEHAAAMPRTMLSYATEHLTPEQRAAYRAARPVNG